MRQRPRLMRQGPPATCASAEFALALGIGEEEIVVLRKALARH